MATQLEGIHLRTVESGDFASRSGITIHPVTNSHEFFEVYRMAYDAYRDQDSPPASKDSVWIPFPEFDHASASTILVAERQGEIVGSVSITFDGPRGLPLDKSFGGRPAFLFRNQGLRLAEIWRLVTKATVADGSMIAAALLQDVVERLKQQEIQTSLVSVLFPYAALCREQLKAVTLWSGHASTASLVQPSTLLRFDLQTPPILA